MKNFSTKEALKFGWQKTRDNFGFVALILVCNGLLIAVNSIIDPEETHHMLRYANGEMSLLAAFISFALALIGLLLSIGTVKFALDIMDGKQIHFRNILSYVEYFWRFLGSRLLSGLITVVGFVLLIIPGIIWGLMFMFSCILVIDRNMGVMDSLHESANIVNGVKWKLLGFFISIGLLNILGAIVALIGLIITIPVSLFATLYVYRSLLNHTTQSPKESIEAVSAEAIVVPENPSI